MKKITIMMTLVLAIGVTNAQETKIKKFELGGNIGMTTFTNYSALSLFQDANDSYSTWSEAIHWGFYRNNKLLGIQAQFALYNTSALVVNEAVSWMDFSLMSRRYFNIGGDWETFIGLKAGLSIMSNGFNYLGETYSFTRLGLLGEFEMGLIYRFDNGNYLGLRSAFNVLGSNFDKDIDLPAGLVGNDKLIFGGYSLMIQYGLQL